MIRDTSAQDVVIDQNPLRKKRLIWSAAIGGVVIILASIVYPAYSRWANAEVSVPVARLRIASVTRGDFIKDISVQGRIIAAVSPTLYSSATGTITLNVNAGDEVKSDEILAVIDSPEINNELEREQANLESLTIEYERQKIEVKTRELQGQQTIDLERVTLEAAERELNRAKLSFDHGVLSQQDLEQKQDELATAKVRHAHAVQDADLQKESLAFDLRTKELEVNRQRLLVDNLQRRVDELTVRSPANGIVGNLAVNQKAAVAPNQALMTVVDLSAFEIELQVPESYADSLGLGMMAEIRDGQKQYAGAVSAISPEVQNNQVTTRVRFDGEVPGDLRQNQRVTVRIVLETSENVLLVKRGPFLESGGGRTVYKVGDGIATRTPVRLGSTSVNAVEIVSGLDVGDEIIISSTETFNSANTVYIRD
ncbi:MAG: efflux RND transporter periplasmic adaptor subunit [Gammaproteobacteria bacterium]|nr:efflux RND transporter periplasmic adaptor subunit [Gammaproteobacteria bacterium]